MGSQQVRQKFLDFFKEKGHAIIPSASLIPENDPTVLFTTAGMHPLVPFLLGEKHPAGNKLADVQICLRTDDIDEVGDEAHHTFFEMLGNWSLGSYWKDDAIKWSFEFLTSKKWLGLEKEKIGITIFAGDKDAPLDEETKKIWLSLGISENKIKPLPKKDNWWGPAGQTGPCGPDTEMFYWTGGAPVPEFDPKDKRWVEIWNDVFMQYFKNMDGVYESLKQKNVDTGMGLERTVAVINGLDDNYKTDLFWPIIKKIEELSGKKYEDNKRMFRIIADHIKAATFIIGDKNSVEPSNLGRGYVARRLIRRAIRCGRQLGMNFVFTFKIAEEVIKIYQDIYPELRKNKDLIINQLVKEEEKFGKTLEKGIQEIRKIKDWLGHNFKNNSSSEEKINIAKELGLKLFFIYQSYGFPLELSVEELDLWGPRTPLGDRFTNEKYWLIDEGSNIEEYIRIAFNEEFKQHQELSRTASAGMFKGGLADGGEKSARYHTATHLLLAALRQVLGDHVYQRGSNINAERLRFDFSHPEKMTEEQLKKIEEIINQKIEENIPVVCQEMSLEEARKKNMMGIFENKYGDKVKTYTIAEFSREICGGPHASCTGELGHFKIIKEESSGAGLRRIKAVLE
ncbi:MAG: alanine--tRNA ligase [Patescibacteria group bacterium]|nr:alanine--tRNA ligase [Patescibacteria group bacterium]MDD5396186.1 alanine--tRNA ligase [Patescibacteria group bacterium]